MLVRPCAYARMPTCNYVAMCACFPVLVFALAARKQLLLRALFEGRAYMVADACP